MGGGHQYLYTGSTFFVEVVSSGSPRQPSEDGLVLTLLPILAITGFQETTEEDEEDEEGGGGGEEEEEEEEEACNRKRRSLARNLLHVFSFHAGVVYDVTD